jgi:photosystem II stability/assembly factor-like uncharacterized protein
MTKAQWKIVPILVVMIMGVCSATWVSAPVSPAPPPKLTLTMDIVVADLSAVISSDGLVWAVGNQGRVLVSEDEGITWAHRNISGRQELETVRTSHNGKKVWVRSEMGILYSSIDTGLTWQTLKLPENVGQDFFVTNNGKHLFAVGQKFAYSHDSGATWGVSDLPLIVPEGIDGVRSDSSGKLVMAAGDGIVFLSENGGASLSSIRIGIHPTHSACANNCREIWFSGFKGGIVKSNDAGKSWRNEVSPTKDRIEDLQTGKGSRKLVGISRENLIYSFGDGQWSRRPLFQGGGSMSVTMTDSGKCLIAVGAGGTIARSTNFGESWSGTNQGIDIGVPEGVGKNRNRLCVAGGPLIGGGSRLACSSDDGKTWNHGLTPEMIGPDRIDAIAPLDAHSWLAIGQQGLVLISLDDGANWKKVAVGTSADLVSIGANDSSKRVVIIGSTGEIFISSDRGKTWIKSENGETSRLRAALITKSGELIIAAGDDGVLLVSKNAGGTFSKKTLSQSSHLFTLGATGDGNFLWAAGEGGLIFGSTDFGETWWRQNEGGPVLNIHALTATDHGDVVVAQGEINDRGQVLVTTDHGKSWNPMLKDPLSAFGILGGYSADDGIHVWTHSYSWVEDTRIARSGTLPIITKVRFSPLVTGKAQLEVIGENFGNLGTKDIRLFAANESNRNNLAPIAALVKNPSSAVEPWTVEFDPAKAGVIQGQKLFLELELSSEGFRHRHSLSPDGFTFDPFWSLKKQWKPLVIAVALSLLLITLSFLLWLRPASLLGVYVLEGYAEGFSDWVSKPLQILLTIAVVRPFAQHSRVLDAWVRAQRSRSRVALNGSPTATLADGFVPLPVRVSSRTGKLIKQPGPDELAPLFRSQRATVQILGPGGAGKTSLAYQIARWMLDEADSLVLLGQPAIVIWMDEDTTDIMATLKIHLRRTLDLEDDLPVALLNALCRRGRIVVVFDRASERRKDTLEALQKVHGQTQISKIMVTSRVRLNFGGGDDTCLYPEFLDSSTLLYFVTSLLHSYENLGGFSRLTDQLKLGERFVPILQTSLLPAGVPVTPLLVRLFVERAIESLQSTGSMDLLPSSVPDLYFDFLKRLNPHDVPDAVSDEELVDACRRLATVSVEPDFLPKEMTLSEAHAVLGSDGTGIIPRLVENGVLAKRTAGAETIMRFSLDPLAEYLAAFASAREAGSSKQAWERLIAKVGVEDRAKGFGVALRLTWERYHMDFKWPEVWESLSPVESGLVRDPA